VLVPQQPEQHARRETFIALRARRKAHQVATDLLYHDEEHPGVGEPWPPRRVLRVSRVRTSFREWIRVGAIILLSIMALCVITGVAFAIAEGLFQLPRLR
jgi:hypothetical protein